MFARRNGKASVDDAQARTANGGRSARSAAVLLVALAFIAQAALAPNASASTGVPCLQTGLETVSTDEPSYPAGSIVHITGTGYAVACDIDVRVTDPAGAPLSETVTTDIAGNFFYDYTIPGPPYVTGTYQVDTLGGGTVLAHTTFEDAAFVNQLLANGPVGTGTQTFVFTPGDTIYSNGTIDAGRNGRIVITDGSGANRFTSACLPEATFEFSGGNPNGPPRYTFVASDPVSTDNAHQWTYTVQQYAPADATCAGATQGTASRDFSFAKATVYSDTGLTTPKSSFAAGGTAYVKIEGFQQATNNLSNTWILPSAATACANTSGGDRPDSSATGLVPDPADSSAAAPSSDGLQYPPRAASGDDPWNHTTNYDGACPAFSASNQGTWKLTVQGDATHLTTLTLFNVDATAPTVTINQASGQADPTTVSPINFTVTFSEAVTGFTGSDVSFTAGTAGGTLSAAVTGGPTVYNVAVTGMTQRGTVVATIPAGGAADAAGNTNTASTSTDNTVTWDRVPAATTPTFSPASPKTNDLLTTSTTTSDPDGDNISVSWTWFVTRGGNQCNIETASSASAPAGVRSVSLNLNANYVPTSCSGPMINPLNPSKGDLVTPVARPNDGLFDGSLQSAAVTIANTLPTVTLAAVNTLSVNEGSTQTYSYAISDADGDTIASVGTSCGANGTLSNASNTNTSGSFDCTFPDGPASSSVSAQATDSGFQAGAGNTATQSVTVNNVAPSIAISGAASVNEGSPYSLTLGAVSDPGTDTVSSYVVHWGDGSDNTYSTNGAKTHTYADGPATRSITVDLVDEDGTFTDRANAFSVTVNNVAPSIAISGAASVNEGSPYSLTLGAVSDPGTDTVTSWIVHWGDGNSNTYSSAGIKTHTYADGPDDHAITVDLVDEDGTFTNAANPLSVHVVNVAPTAHLSGPDEVNEGTTHLYTFTVTDPGDDSFTVNTPAYPDCGTGGDYVGGSLLTNLGGGSFECSFPDGPTTTDVKIRVTDSDGASDTDTENVVVVDVANVDPVVSLTGPGTVAEGSTHSYSYTTSDVGTPETFNREAQSCDGGTLSAASFNPFDGSGSFDCTYADGPSSHNPSVTVSDGDSGSDSDSLAVTVTNVAPSIAISGAASVNEGSPYSLTLGAVSDPGTDTVTSYVVHWGDGNSNTYTSDGVKTHTYADGPNDWNITVDLVDEDGTFTNAANPHSVHFVNVAPSTPSLLTPADGATTSNTTPTFDWSDSTDPGVDAVTYTIQANLGSCDFTGTNEVSQSGLATSTFTPAAPLADGTYCWHVQATDSENPSAWSATSSFTIDSAVPSVSVAPAAGQGDPTNNSPINFTVTFSENVTGFASSDVTLGGTAGATTAVVTGGPAIYNVAASGMTSNGTVTVSVPANSAKDAAGNNNTASNTATVTYDTAGPTVTINQASGQADPTSSSPINFTAVFSEVVGSSFGNADVTIGGTAGATNASVTNPSSDGKTFNVAISGMTTNGTVTATIGANKATDAAGNGNAASTSMDNTVTYNASVGNTPPTVTINTPTFGQLYAKPGYVNLSATFTDPDAGQTHTCSINWDDGTTTTPAVNQTTKTCAQAHTYNAPGVYTIVVTIYDSVGGSGSAEVMIVVYDASAGFITGGGWIQAQPGSYPANPTLAGRANFGFNAKYKKGATVPDGETEFQFQVGNLNFHSESYSWLVVSGYKAQFKGTGTLNGVTGYDFTLTAYDGQISGAGNTGFDRFRIRITKNNAVVFDNRNGVSPDMDTADPQNIAGGSIVIHKA